jgi:hypothetical protein
MMFLWISALALRPQELETLPSATHAYHARRGKNLRHHVWDKGPIAAVVLQVVGLAVGDAVGSRFGVREGK